MSMSSTKTFYTFSLVTITLFVAYIATATVNALELEEPANATAAAESVEAATAAPTSAPAPDLLATFQESQHYITKFPNSSRSKKPQVIEFFSYMCPHCYRMEATVKRWLKQKPADVEFVKVPVAFQGNALYGIAARAHYIAEELGVLEQFGPAMFARIHVDRRPPRNDRDLAKLFAELGVSEADFKKAADNNFNVVSNLRRANYLADQYNVNSVPYFLINYKYEMGPESQKSQEALFALWNNLPYKDFR